MFYFWLPLKEKSKIEGSKYVSHKGLARTEAERDSRTIKGVTETWVRLSGSGGEKYMLQKRKNLSTWPEPNSRHRESQWKNIGYFIMKGATQENGNLTLKSLNSPMTCGLQILWSKLTRHCGLRAWGQAGSWWVRSGVRIINNFQVLRTAQRSYPVSLCLVSWRSSQGLFRLRDEELKHNFGQDARFGLPEVWATVFCCPGGCWWWGGRARPLVYRTDSGAGI